MKNETVIFARAKKSLYGYESGELVPLVLMDKKLTLFIDGHLKNPRTFPPNELDFI